MEQRLRESGLKATRQRVAILRCLEQAGGEALTAEELFEQLNPTTGVDRSTVYRCLEALENHHLVERMEHRGGACYCIAGKNHRHLLMCVRCHKTVPIHSCPLHAMEESIGKDTGFVMLSHTLEMTGICPDCASKK